MDFLDRAPELARLDRAARSAGAALAVVWGRRRVGKTRLLVEWCGRRRGTYVVADQSAAPLQRAFVAEALAARFPGFADASYPDWGALLRRLALEAQRSGWRGPLVLDELPYLVEAAPELPSVLQRFIDHEAQAARLCVVVAGSSQRMMQGIVLDANAPLYGRARELIPLAPLEIGWLPGAFPRLSAKDAVEHFTVWGGLPHHWELARGVRARSLERRVDALVLDPSGALHREPDQLLMEEQPPATSLRPILDAIGLGAHRVSEIAGRVGVAATSLARPLQRLIELGLVERETPFGESEKGQKRSLYQMSDPFFRMWFRVVAPQRSFLAQATAPARIALWRRHRIALVSATWERLCRAVVPRLALPGLPRFGPAQRYWRGSGPEWDIVARSIDGRHVLLGEAKWSSSAGAAADAAAALADKGLPPGVARGERVHRVVFVAARTRGEPRLQARVLDAADVVRALR